MAEQKIHGVRARLDYMLKHNYAFNRAFTWIASSFLKLLGVFLPINQKLVVFSAHSRKYNDSPRTLYEYMIGHLEFKDYIFVWGLEDPDNSYLPGPAIKVKADTLAYFKYAMKARYWITCVNIERSLHFKKKGCLYLNTWHGTPFKYVGNDAKKRKDYDFRDVDFFCYSSEYDKEIFKRAFNVREEALRPTGLPRNDELYSVTDEKILDKKKKLGLPLDKKIILYAPTWRDSTDNGATYSIQPPIDANKWEKELGNDYVVLFRTHGYTNKLLGISFNETIRDYSDYPAINDLFTVSDILISDYSASMADYSILERPILCFAYDYNQYCEERGLYLDFDKEMPSGILLTEDDVLNYINQMDYVVECRKTKEMIKDRITNYGGQATMKCIEFLFSNS